MVRTTISLILLFSTALCAAAGLQIEPPQPDPHDRHAVTEAPAAIRTDPLLPVAAGQAVPLRAKGDKRFIWGPVEWEGHTVLIRIDRGTKTTAQAWIDGGEPVRLPVQRFFRRLVVGPLVADHLSGTRPVRLQQGPFYWLLIRDGVVTAVRQPLEVQYVDDELAFDLMVDQPRIDVMSEADRQQWIADFWQRENALRQAAGLSRRVVPAP